MQSTVTSPPKRILIIDDNDAIHEDFRKALNTADGRPTSLDDAEAILFGNSTPAPSTPRFDLESAMQGQDGLSRLKAAVDAGTPFQVAFVDMRMPPGWDGLQTIQQLWKVDGNLQVVICTAYSDYSWQEISEKLGLTDRLLILKKPFDPVEVFQTAAALSEKWNLGQKAHLKMEELERLVEVRTADLAHAALHDKLTGLPNRSLICDRLAKAIARRKRESNYNFALFFMDFDRFKVINDSLGHDVGDALLVAISKRLVDSLRATDSISAPEHCTAGRLGGDEFVILADDIKRSHDVGIIAERLLETFREPYEVRGHRIASSASIGVTTADLEYDRPEDMLRDADTAMYNAKAAGKARYVVFDQNMHQQVIARLELENQLRQVIERKELLLHYQPVVSLTTGSLDGFEALVRWNHPVRGIVAPGEFIPCCEETGLIIPIGLWVLREACQQLKLWRSQFSALPGLRMSVNLSAKQLSTPDFVRQVENIFREVGVSANSITLEITESLMIRNFDAVIPILNQLKSLGVSLQMDDFGTGYSSLSCLHRLPLNGIKIDRSFVNSVGERRDYAAVIQGIITMARNLGMTLVAEGIETADQAVMLQTMDCDAAQGFFFSKPMDVKAAQAYIQKMAAGGFTAAHPAAA